MGRGWQVDDERRRGRRKRRRGRLLPPRQEARSLEKEVAELLPPPRQEPRPRPRSRLSSTQSDALVPAQSSPSCPLMLRCLSVRNGFVGFGNGTRTPSFKTTGL